MSSILQPISQSGPHPRPTRVEVHLDRLAANLAAIREAVGGAVVMPVLKANAYGHGMVEVARFLEGHGVEYFGVAVLEEGLLLRERGVKTPVLVMGGLLDDQVPDFIEHDLTLTASSIDKLEQIEHTARRLGRRAKVHLKVDTGMERIGVHWYSARPFIEKSWQCRHIEVEGLYSHVAAASSASSQLQRFHSVLDMYQQAGQPLPKFRHMANSEGIVSGVLKVPGSPLNMVRPGLLLFGVNPEVDSMAPTARTLEVQPALEWKTQVVYFKVVQPGNPVSYGGTWRSEKLVRVITLPVGYGDGYFRAASNRATVLLQGRRYRQVGQICMDQMMVSIDWDEAYNGDEVVLIGRSGEDEIRVADVARWAGTIPYEVLTNINTRVPRLYL